MQKALQKWYEQILRGKNNFLFVASIQILLKKMQINYKYSRLKSHL